MTSPFVILCPMTWLYQSKLSVIGVTRNRGSHSCFQFHGQLARARQDFAASVCPAVSKVLDVARVEMF